MDIHELFTKALHNEAFWKELKKDPVKAFQNAGIKTTSQQIDSVKQLNYESLEKVATAFSSGNVT